MSHTLRVPNAFWLILFAVSGAASLTYQVVWQRVLTQEIGVDSVSVTLIVAIFMLGLGFGGLFGARLASRVRNVAVALAVLEAVIGAFGFLSIGLIRELNRVFLAEADLWVQLSANFGLLLIPTLAMGATTPLMVEIYRDDISRGRSVGSAYAANIVGAATGVVICGFLLIGTFGLTITSYIVAALDVVVAVFFFAMAKRFQRAGDFSVTTTKDGTLSSRLLTGIFLIGVATLGYEVVFFRLFTTYFGVTSYVFPMLLFAYLANMAFGTWLGGCLSERWPLSRVLAIGISATVIFSLPILWLQQFLLGFGQAQMSLVFNPNVTSFEQNLSLIATALLLSLALLIPVAASSIFLPSIVASVRSKLGKGTVFGKLYFVQTIGNTTGSLVTGFILYSFLDSPTLLAVLAVTLSAGVFLVYVTTNPFSSSYFKLLVPVLIVAIGIGFFNFDYAKSVRYFRTVSDPVAPIWQRDSIHGMTLVYDRYGDRSSYAALAGGRFWITGIPGTRGWARDRGFVEPLVFAVNPNVKRILFIGVGTGSELLSLRDLYPEAEVTVVEINPDLMDAFSTFAHIPIRDELKRSVVRIDDGRRFLQHHRDEKFDYIQIGVHRATTSGTGNLFSQDFLRKIRENLSPGGVVSFYAYPPVVKGALAVFGDVAVFTKNDSLGIALATAEENYILRPGFNRRHETAEGKVGSFLTAKSVWKDGSCQTPIEMNVKRVDNVRPWMPCEAVIYPKSAISDKLANIKPATDDHLVTEYFLNNNTEVIGGAHRSNKPIDYRAWPFSDGAIPFLMSIGGEQVWQNARRETRTVKGEIAQFLKSGATTPAFLPAGSLALANLTDLATEPYTSYQWDFPVVKPYDTTKETYWRYHGTCDKRGRGLWGLKAYFADKDGWKVYNMQSASRGENSLSLAFSTPPGVEEVHFAVTFDNAPGIGTATKLGCTEFVNAEYY
jgi:spermidine synthase